MTLEFLSPRILELLLLLAIVFHGSNVDPVEATVPKDTSDVSLSATTLQAATMVPVSSANGETVTVVDLVGPWAEVTGPLEKMARRRESGAVAEPIARARVPDGAEDEEYDNEDDYAVADDTKMRRDLRRKAIAGRHYRDGPKIWDQWGKWTSCSASCGAGKLTRWRHCIGGGCSLGEKEAQLKTCTYSAC